MCYHMPTDNAVQVLYSFHHVQNRSRGFKSQVQRKYIVSDSKLLLSSIYMIYELLLLGIVIVRVQKSRKNEAYIKSYI